MQLQDENGKLLQTHAHAQAHAHSLTNAYTHTYTYSHTRTHKHTHTCTYARTNRHHDDKHTHIHDPPFTHPFTPPPPPLRPTARHYYSEYRFRHFSRSDPCTPSGLSVINRTIVSSTFVNVLCSFLRLSSSPAEIFGEAKPNPTSLNVNVIYYVHVCEQAR